MIRVQIRMTRVQSRMIRVQSRMIRVQSRMIRVQSRMIGVQGLGFMGSGVMVRIQLGLSCARARFQGCFRIGVRAGSQHHPKGRQRWA